MKNLFYAFFASVMMASAAFVSCNKDETGSYIPFSASPAGYTSPALSVDAQTQPLTISSPSSWTITSNQNWVVANPSSGAAGRSNRIELTISENTDENARQAILTITASATGKTPLRVSVVQLGTSGEPWAGETDVQWIYSVLYDNYYWNRAVQAATPNYDLPYDEFLMDLIVNLDGAEDADGTMDGGYYAPDDRYVYSYVSRTPAATRAIDTDGKETTFGFGIYAYAVSGNNPTNYIINAIVTWVRPGSPADGVLKRGMVINRYGGAVINYAAYEKLLDQVYYGEGDNSMTLGIVSEASPITLTSAYFEMNPILYSGTIESPVLKKKVAYLVYNEFETGPRNGNTYKFDDYIRSSFRNFAGADELVLDLRYNLGGYVSSCQVLTSLIANTATANTTFAYLTYNQDLPEEHLYFRNEADRLSTINRVYVLTTGYSASASEMVINALRGIDFEVIQIGERTEGKNVGMNRFEETIEGYDYEMWPITFKISNAKGFSDYADGFEPDYRVGDLATGTIYDLGNPKEALLKRALELIDGTRTAAFAEDTRTETKLAGIPYPRPLPGGGARIPHPPGAETGMETGE